MALRKSSKRTAEGANNVKRAAEGTNTTSKGLNKDKIKHLQECAERTNVLLTKSLISDFMRLYDLNLEPLEYLDDSMLKIYSAAFLYSKSANVKRQAFCKGMKKGIFDNALKEVLAWEIAPPSKEDKNPTCNRNLTCNLYSIVFDG